MIIACAIDRNYVELAGVLLNSIEQRGNIEDASFVVVHDGLRASDITKIQQCCRRHVEFLKMEDSLRREIFRLPPIEPWSSFVYTRLFLPGIISSDDRRILYLDADIIVSGDISELCEFDMQGNALAAVGEVNLKLNERLGVSGDMLSFNSGVLLIDAKKWKDLALTQKICAAAKELESRGKLIYPDQDALAYALAGNIAILPEIFNFQRKTNSHGQARIIHFTHWKPNTKRCTHPAQALYLGFRKNTPWRRKALHGETRRSLHRWQRILSKGFRRFMQMISPDVHPR